MKSVPAGLERGVHCEPVKVGHVYNTTSQLSYRPRAMTIPAAPIQKKAAGNWRVHYTMHTIDKVSPFVAWEPKTKR